MKKRTCKCGSALVTAKERRLGSCVACRVRARNRRRAALARHPWEGREDVLFTRLLFGKWVVA